MIEIIDNATIAEVLRKGEYPECLCNYLETRLSELRTALAEGGEDPLNLSLKEFGYPVILEPSDNLRHLEDAGLCGSLFECVPEMVERLIFDGYRVYCFSVAFNNSFMLEFLLPDDADGRKYKELATFLKRWACRDVYKTRSGLRKKAA